MNKQTLQRIEKQNVESSFAVIVSLLWSIYSLLWPVNSFFVIDLRVQNLSLLSNYLQPFAVTGLESTLGFVQVHDPLNRILGDRIFRNPYVSNFCDIMQTYV